MGIGGLHEAKCAPETGFKAEIDDLVGMVHNRSGGQWGALGIVDQDIDPSEELEGLGHRGINTRPLGHVAMDKEGLAPQFLQLRDDLPPGFFIEVGDHAASARLRH